MVYEAVRTSINDEVKWGGGGMWKGSFGCEFFYVGRCVQREWVVEGDGFYGYFSEQRLPVGVQEYLEG